MFLLVLLLLGCARAQYLLKTSLTVAGVTLISMSFEVAAYAFLALTSLCPLTTIVPINITLHIIPNPHHTHSI